MVNHARTLLLNLAPNNGVEEYIPSDYLPKTLPKGLQGFYDILFPKGCSRAYALSCAQAYMELITGSDLREYVTALDPRITYDLTNSHTFVIRRIGEATGNDPDFPLHVYGDYTTQNYYLSTQDTIKISQDTSYDEVRITSASGNWPEMRNVALTFTNGLSNVVPVATTGLNIRFGSVGNTFNPHRDLLWSVAAQSPFDINVSNTIELVENSSRVVSDMLSYNKSKVPTTFEQYWIQHFNRSYRFAGLLMAYIYRLSNG